MSARKNLPDVDLRGNLLYGELIDENIELQELFKFEEAVTNQNLILGENGTCIKGNISIPSWSLQDRVQRIYVVRPLWVKILGSNLPLALIFISCFICPLLFGNFSSLGREVKMSVVISCFIIIHTVATLIQAIPAEDASNSEVNNRVNASILYAMTLYCCFGLWSLDVDEPLTWANFWETLGFDHLYTQKNIYGVYQWGYVFPFFFWATSAIILTRDLAFPFTKDRLGVITGENGSAVTGLFRRNPTRKDIWTHQITSMITFSLWTILPNSHRPAGKAGRFAFQLVAPVVAMFVYVGYRFVRFSIDRLGYIVSHPEDYTMVISAKASCNYSFELAEAHVIVWSMFTFYCIIIRAVIGRKDFLSFVVPDPQSSKKRWEGWSSAIVESKRRRVLWAFRGLTNAFVPYYILISPDPRPNTVLDWLCLYIYFGVYVSFLFEGIGAIWFGLLEAERSCNLNTPFREFTNLSFWGAFNAYLQPFGTLTNVLIYCINKEYGNKLVLREIWGPLLLNSRNNFRSRIRLPVFLRQATKKPTNEELDERLKEWIATWSRKRQEKGRDTTNFSVKRIGEVCPRFEGRKVFHGTMFPTRGEWTYMRDHYEEYITLQPWERVYGPEKFLQWYPSYREEIISLLKEPYDFDIRREVWMFGYGSLISPDSPPAGLTEMQRKLIIPYWLKKQAGYRRTWNYRHGSCGINAYGLEKMDREEDGINICGCVYPMNYENASELFSFREEGYELLFIHRDYFHAMHPDFSLPEGIGYLWVCGQPTLKCKDPLNNFCSDIDCKRHSPTRDSPILQSYIDTVLEGALRYKTAGSGHVDGMNFAAAIILSTSGWDSPWYNDRLLAGRPWCYSQKYEIIDGLLSTCETSRDVFINRLCTSMQSLSTKRGMLETVKESLLGWANIQFPTYEPGSSCETTRSSISENEAEVEELDGTLRTPSTLMEALLLD